jgi:hypothetical protein
MLPQILDNAGDAVSSPFPKGKQQGDYYVLAAFHNISPHPKGFITYETSCRN